MNTESILKDYIFSLPEVSLAHMAYIEMNTLTTYNTLNKSIRKAKYFCIYGYLYLGNCIPWSLLEDHHSFLPTQWLA